MVPARPSKRKLGIDSGAFTTMSAEPHVPTDEWVVRPPTVPGAKRPEQVAARAPKARPVTDDDGTPVDVSVSVTVSPLSPDGPPGFVAGEIDVPTPAPEIVQELDDDGNFTAASTMLGPRSGAGDATPK